MQGSNFFKRSLTKNLVDLTKNLLALTKNLVASTLIIFWLAKYEGPPNQNFGQPNQNILFGCPDLQKRLGAPTKFL